MEPIKTKEKDDLWFYEYQSENLKLGLRITEILRNIQTPYQRLLVFETEEYGRTLALDGVIMFTEQNEFTYHEMMAHLLMSSHPDPKNVLVVGGGDGGCVREVVKYDCLESVTLVDIDKEVTRASIDFFPGVSSGLADPRVEICPTDALQYIKDHENSFDIVIVDSTDPVDFAVGLFEAPFYNDVKKSLRDKGMVIAQTESPFVSGKLLNYTFNQMKLAFPSVSLAWGIVPFYPSGAWTYTIGSKGPDPRNILREPNRETQYYSRKIHETSFVLPPFIQKILESPAD